MWINYEFALDNGETYTVPSEIGNDANAAAVARAFVAGLYQETETSGVLLQELLNGAPGVGQVLINPRHISRVGWSLFGQAPAPTSDKSWRFA